MERLGFGNKLLDGIDHFVDINNVTFVVLSINYARVCYNQPTSLSMKPILTAMIAIPTSIPSKGNMPTNNRRRLIGASLPLASLPFPSSMFVTKGAPL